MVLKTILALLKESGKKWKYIIILLTIFVAFAEIIMLLFLLPVIKIVKGDDVGNDRFLILLKEFLNIDIKNTISILGFFCIIVVAASLLKQLLLISHAKYSIEIASILSKRVFYQLLYGNSESNKREKVISIISTKIDIITNKILISSLTSISSVIILLLVTVALSFYVSLTILIFLIFILSAYILTYVLTSRFQNISGSIFRRESSSLVSKIIDVTSGVKEIKLAKLESYILNDLITKDSKIRKSQVISNIIGQLPKSVIETLGYLVIILGIYLNYKFNYINNNDLIIYLGISLVAIQRLIPLCQQTYQSITNIKYAIPIIYELFEFINKNHNIDHFDKKTIFYFKTFEKFELKNIEFSFNRKKTLFQNINMSINRGEVIGIVGKSGSGKSTLIDIICGLKIQTAGNVLVNGKVFSKSQDWSSLIFLVPQKPTLFDMSILQNIVLTCNDQEIDHQRLQLSLKISKFQEVIDLLKLNILNGYGEYKNLLSGGQKQKLALARAIYSNKKIVVLDEATNAIDVKSEEEFFKSFKEFYPDKTLIVVSHRDNIISYCHKIYKL